MICSVLIILKLDVRHVLAKPDTRKNKVYRLKTILMNFSQQSLNRMDLRYAMNRIQNYQNQRRTEAHLKKLIDKVWSEV